MSESSIAATPVYDLLVVGGGINGVGIARDAAGRGLKVLLCEQDDLAAHTSSASSKLVHGGLRYLQQGAFRLVSKSLAEREVLLRAAPHIIRPLEFVIPHQGSARPAWLLGLGLWLYDHLDFGQRRLLPGSARIDLRQHEAGASLRDDLRTGFVYADAWADDARLVVLNAMDAAERGADVLVGVRCVEALRDRLDWRVRLRAADACERQVRARCLVNATGPWVSEFLAGVARQHSHYRIRHVKGTHVAVPRLYEHPYAYLLQNSDGRVIFAVPYERDYTLLGTTDEDYAGDLRQIRASAAEVEYLCAAASAYFRTQVGPADVVWRFAGVRPLLDDRSASNSRVTRDYRLELNTDAAPLLSVFGGKLTTYRKLAEEALDRLQPVLGFASGHWTAGACLPGGDIEAADFEGLVRASEARWPWLPSALVRRYVSAYGNRVTRLLGNASSLADLGADLGGGVYVAELRYLREREWARTPADVLWRRSKLGLHLSEASKRQVEAWFDAHPFDSAQAFARLDGGA